jgi:hypothetical protein
MVARGESRGEKRGARPLAVGTPSGVVVVLLEPALSLALTPQLVYKTDCEEAAGGPVTAHAAAATGSFRVPRQPRESLVTVLLDMTNLLCCPLGSQVDARRGDERAGSIDGV